MTRDRMTESGRSAVRLRGESGMSIVELMMVLAVLSILITVLGFSAKGWINRYKVEDDVKRMYIDIVEARARAMQRARATFVTVTSGDYAVYEDTSPAPDGNGTLEAGTDRLVTGRSTNSPIVNDLGGTLTFGRDGIASLSGTIYLSTDENPEVNGINIGPTRVKLGRYHGGVFTEK
jgi:prepilin-type N-terminal cleavage/methylation domain-containing protein